jgi:3-deoxy-manno-octulosonate cytidylyltransferase (CMP-KDO synthetase)
MRKIIAMIPARVASTRFPGKPLVDICGKPMIEHVWQRVRLNKKIEDIYIATCDKEIKEKAESFGAKVIMTSDKHTRCTDRIAEACLKLDKEGYNFDVVLNIQGDEPLLNPDTLDLLIKPFIGEEGINCVNLIEVLEGDAEINSYNNVKAIFDQQGYALYFSRLPIPSGLENKHYKQLGLYGLTKEMALKYLTMKETPLEIAESDDMLRFVENGIKVKVVVSPYKTKGLDTPFDRDVIVKIMETDSIFRKYGEL